MAHQKIIDSVKKQGQVTIKDLDEFLRFVINEYDMRTLNNNYISILIPMQLDVNNVFGLDVCKRSDDDYVILYSCWYLWVDEDVTCVKSMNDDYLNRQKAITEKQLSDLSSGIFLQNFDYIVYGKRLASKSENTVEFVENTIVSHNKQELEVVASGMEAMGLSVETGYYDPDDESSVDVPKQLIGFHYVVLKKKD